MKIIKKIIDFITPQEAKIDFRSLKNEITISKLKEQQKEIKKLKLIIKKVDNRIGIVYEVIGQQPSQNVKEDNWILENLEAIQEMLSGGIDYDT